MYHTSLKNTVHTSVQYFFRKSNRTVIRYRNNLLLANEIERWFKRHIVIKTNSVKSFLTSPSTAASPFCSILNASVNSFIVIK